jgi:hypothetical protein
VYKGFIKEKKHSVGGLRKMGEYSICQVCGVNELIDDDELETGMCRDCMSSLMSDGVYCD